MRRIGSPIRREGSQRATLLGLGLKRANQVVELEDTPAIARHDPQGRITWSKS